MNLSRIVTGFLVSFIFFVFILQWWVHPSVTPEIWISLLGAGLCAGLLIYHGEKETGFITLAIIGGSSLALLIVIHAVHVTTARDIESFANGTSQTLTGWVADIPDRRPEVTKYKIAVTSVEQNGISKDARGFILVNDHGVTCPEVARGIARQGRAVHQVGRADAERVTADAGEVRVRGRR